MRIVDFNASVSNLTQLERHQQDGHRAPMIDQESNILKAREEAQRRAQTAVEPEQSQEKTIDPRDRREKQNPRHEKKSSRNKKKKSMRGPRPDGGRFVDVDA